MAKDLSGIGRVTVFPMLHDWETGSRCILAYTTTDGGLTAVLAPLQLVIGDQHGLNTLEHQPIKVAAMEAHWDGNKPGDFHIFAWPDETAGVNHFELSIPKAASSQRTPRASDASYTSEIR